MTRSASVRNVAYAPRAAHSPEHRRFLRPGVHDPGDVHGAIDRAEMDTRRFSFGVPFQRDLDGGSHIRPIHFLGWLT